MRSSGLGSGLPPAADNPRPGPASSTGGQPAQQPSGASGQSPPSDLNRLHLRGATQLAVLPRTLPSARDLHVYIVDDWASGPSINVSRADQTRDLSHGATTEEIIRRGLPDARISRIDSRQIGGPLSTVLTRSLDSVINQHAKAQGVPRDKADLSNVVFNVSQSQATLTPEQRGPLSKAVAEFTARGGRIYMAAGNKHRNPLIDVPGVIGVDGSKGVIGEPTDTRANPKFDNGFVRTVANSVVVPQHAADGGVRLSTDTNRVLPPGSQTPPPAATFANKRLADVLIDEKAAVPLLQRRDALMRDAGALMHKLNDTAAKDAGPLESRLGTLNNNIAALDKQLGGIAAGKLVRVSMVDTGNEQHENQLNREVVPRNIDRDRVFIDGRFLTTGLSGDAGQLLYEADKGGIVRPLSVPGVGVANTGTSWATPNHLVETEVQRLLQQQGKPAQP